MIVRTTDQLFPHKCQIKDMKLSGFSPNSIRYHCSDCGGVLILKLDRDHWESVFGDRRNLNLSKSILQQLDAVVDEEELEAANSQMGEPDKFVWSPPED